MNIIFSAIKIASGIIADIATLGGTVNDGYFLNGKCSYTTRAIRSISTPQTPKQTRCDEGIRTKQ